jgi:esterase/lipase
MGGVKIKNVQIPHGVYNLKGRIYKASGEEPKPSAIICHGYPGDTKNMDLAEELALNGYNVLVFYYMGAWGSEGTYRFKNLTPSTKSALDWFIGQPYVDSGRVALISHSMGAVPLTNLMAEDKRVKTAVLMAPASDLSSWMSEEVVDNVFKVFVQMKEGKLATGDDDEYKADMVEGAKNLNPVEKVKGIHVPLMVIVGSADTVTVPEGCRGLYDNANEPKKWVLVEGADHSFTEHRIPLQKNILEWLSENL